MWRSKGNVRHTQRGCALRANYDSDIVLRTKELPVFQLESIKSMPEGTL